MLLKKIVADLVNSQKEKNEVAVSCLRMLKSSLMNKEIEKRTKMFESNPELSAEKIEELAKLDDREIIDIISTEVKKRRDSVAGFKAGNREDLALREIEEIEVLKNYLPEELSEEEIKKIVLVAIEKTGATSIKEIGLVMKEVVPQTKGRADGNIVGEIVRSLLGE